MVNALAMPKLGLTMKEGRIVEWLKKEGDRVEKGEEIVEIETEKVSYKVPATDSGILLKILAEPKSSIACGETIAFIGEPNERIPEAPVEIAAAPAKPSEIAVTRRPEVKPVIERAVKVSPRARRLAEAHKVKLEFVKGTGPGGSITEVDVRRFIEEEAMRTSSGLKVKKIIPVTGVRNVIAERMMRNITTSAQLTITMEADVFELRKIVERLNSEPEIKKQTRMSFTDFIKIVARALEDHPIMNSTLEGEEIKIIDNINIGVAAATDAGLIVPVIHNADQLNLVGLAKKVNDLANRARNNKLTPDEISGGTYTITNVGTFGNVFGTPIINQPQVAIMALGAIRKIPAVIETPEGDFIGIRHKMFLSHAYDHRVVDGALGGMFVKRVAEYLESFDPEREI